MSKIEELKSYYYVTPTTSRPALKQLGDAYIEGYKEGYEEGYRAFWEDLDEQPE